MVDDVDRIVEDVCRDAQGPRAGGWRDGTDRWRWGRRLAGGGIGGGGEGAREHEGAQDSPGADSRAIAHR